MRAARSTALLLVLFWCASGAAAPTPGPTPPAAADALRRKEDEARVKSAADFVELAKFCASKSAYDDARKAYENALALTPDAADLRAASDKLKGRKSSPWSGILPQIEDRRGKCLGRCAEFMAPVASAYAAADRGDDVERVAGLLRVVGAPPAALDVAWFAPYFEWRSKKDVEKLEAGGELVDGVWLEPAQVAEQNAAHAAWENPWVVSDDACEVRTTQPLRLARQTLRRAAKVRAVELRYFAGEWDLRLPATKLRVFLDDTQNDVFQRSKQECPDAPPPPPGAVAWFAEGRAQGSACFACLEALDAKGRATKLGFADISWPLARAVASQTAFEGSKQAAGPARLAHGAVWAIQGVAGFTPYLMSGADGEILVSQPSWIPWCGKEVDSAFNWCRTNADKVPSLDEFVSMPRSKFDKNPENAQIATTLAWFLLEGDGRAYRAGFLKFLALVHQDRDESDAFTTCMTAASLPALDVAFHRFCKSIRVQER